MVSISTTLSNVVKNNISQITKYFEISNQIIIVLIDKKKHIIDCNQGFLQILNIKEKPLQKKITEYLSPESKKIFLTNKKDFVQIRLTFLSIDKIQVVLEGYIILTKNFYLMLFEKQKLIYNELIKKMSILNNELTNMTRELNKKNIELKIANETIKKLVKIDPLTGLLNRRAFKEYLHRNISLSKRHNTPLTLVMSDIDHFKSINDTYGHELGDAVLINVAKILRKSCRTEDIVARFGGEEFVSILPNTSAVSAIHCTERLRKKIEELKIRGIKQKVTISFGLTELKGSDTEASFIERADEALYEAKRSGRNRSVIK